MMHTYEVTFKYFGDVVDSVQVLSGSRLSAITSAYIKITEKTMREFMFSEVSVFLV